MKFLRVNESKKVFPIARRSYNNALLDTLSGRGSCFRWIPQSMLFLQETNLSARIIKNTIKIIIEWMKSLPDETLLDRILRQSRPDAVAYGF